MRVIYSGPDDLFPDVSPQARERIAAMFAAGGRDAALRLGPAWGLSRARIEAFLDWHRALLRRAEIAGGKT